MFQSRTKNQRGRSSASRRKNRHGATRRLRIEGMERRLMLSASTPEATPEVSLFSKLRLEFGYFAAPTALVGQVTQEGGPIFMAADDTNGTSTAGIYSSWLPPAQFDSLYLGPTVDSNGVNVSNGVNIIYWDRDASVVRDTSVQPVSMYLNYNLGTIEAKVAMVSVHTEATTPPYSEGGSIAIGSVVAELKQQPASSATAEKPAESHTAEGVGDARPKTHESSAAASFIPGEWGRASVFEMVGGTRSADEQGMQNVQRAKARGDQTRSDIALPLLVSDETAAPQNQASQAASDQTHRDKETAITDRSQQSTPTGDAPAPAPSGPIGTHSVLTKKQAATASAAASKISEARGGPTAMIDSSDARGATIAAAMDELGSADQTSGMWRRSRVAAGVILVLALERVAAFHKREASRKASDAKSVASVRIKPKRQRLPGGLQLDAR